jgi:peptide-methionine (S)-S-oxide reductase
MFGRVKSRLPEAAETLPGRDQRSYDVPATHAVLGTPLEGPVPDGHAELFVGTGCFWGAERKLWQLPGVYVTSVGYQGGSTPNPTYDEVCTGRTGHAETVRVVYDPAVLPTRDLLIWFWENHDPTQGFRQGNDVGTQYRSTVYVTDDEQRALAKATRDEYQAVLSARGYDPITTEIADAPTYYPAEAYHQQYLYKNPHGYDCHSSTGLRFPTEPTGS